MEKKILWIVSFAVIIILWMKAGPSKDAVSPSAPVSKQGDEQNKVAPKKVEPKASQAADKALTSKKVEKTHSNEEDVTEDEQNYFKSHPVNKGTPDFAAITDVKTRKKAFFEFLTPFVNEKNTLILEDRKRLTTLLNKVDKLSQQDKQWISKRRKDQRLDVLEKYTKEDINALLNRLDIIPVSLVLAQSANESAWGTSRFATQGNNFFGQWCFRKGCGLVPESRDSDADHEVRKFNDARESVFAYIDNLNTNAAYKKLRAIRLALREAQQTITGLELVHGLEHYSERGQAYVDEIEGLINYNKLWRFNRNSEQTPSTEER
ncbi:glucosaminidase domain-containing protein [Marinomonas algarum]|uniref:Glucosaminidase domain-containing protein n=1 Tax=Marinomonas algarum TaxID=2883105 RepID=A0A9X1ILB2_9GAMM|nr:glucosaminidase domain-containing protein [Marinomonas algarum]MCB5161604.1 glucosaminidase domain-containing protein [Marinomonas algarum]